MADSKVPEEIVKNSEAYSEIEDSSVAKEVNLAVTANEDASIENEKSSIEKKSNEPGLNTETAGPENGISSVEKEISSPELVKGSTEMIDGIKNLEQENIEEQVGIESMETDQITETSENNSKPTEICDNVSVKDAYSSATDKEVTTSKQVQSDSIEGKSNESIDEFRSVEKAEGIDENSRKSGDNLKTSEKDDERSNNDILTKGTSEEETKVDAQTVIGATEETDPLKETNEPTASTHSSIDNEPITPSKTYANEFERFLMESEEKKKGSLADQEDGKSSSGSSKESAPKSKRKIFDQEASEETSCSSWYKISENKEEESMDISDTFQLPPDENSNLSLADNISVVSSNIGENSCMSFQDQASNMDESSNLSIPDNPPSVPTFSGHAPDFDESANMNPPSNVTFLRPDTPNSVTADSSENTPAKKTRRGTLQIAAEDASEHGHDLTAADIFEYQWPQEPDAEYYMLQEQISIYLDVKSFKRKYPDMFRRVCDKTEKDYLRDKGCVSETQSDLGLTALKSEDIHEFMSRDYPKKYKEFLKVLHEREKQRIASKMKEYDTPKLEKEKMMEYTKRATKATSDWNRNFMKKRNEERRAYFDISTFSIQFPKNKFRKLEAIKTQPTAYPLSLIPGQFQEYHRKYTSEELKYFPLNTSLFNPPKRVDEMARRKQMEEDNESQEEDAQKTGSASGSDSEEDSSDSSSSEESDEEVTKATAKPDKLEKKVRKEKSSSREASKEKSAEPSVKQEPVAQCRICSEDSDDKRKKKKQPPVDEEMIQCSECKRNGHPSCLDLTGDMLKVIKTYPWQCMECKTCVQCMDPYDEDKMLFCDKCDRGYHTFCVGLKALPTGKWECMSCRGDSTPIKALPRPPPKVKRGPGRPRLYGKGTPNGKSTPNGKPAPAEASPKQTPSREARASMREKMASKDAKEAKA